MVKRSQEKESPPPLLRSADLILPYLIPPDLCTTSSTCKALYLISKQITALRSSDASQSFEPLPIPFLNSVDSHPYDYFIYTRALVIPRGLDPDLEIGCECGGCGVGCPCRGVDWECGPGCGCGEGCGNRGTQGGVGVRVKVVRDGRKGWGLVAGEVVPRGKFVCEYAGEVLTTEEARKRQQKYDQPSSNGKLASALLVIREHLPSGKACMRINIDATLIGNVARFINHSCDGGNLSTVLVRSSGAILPRLCFLASRDIGEGEELSFSYGEGRVRSNGLKCFCGSSCCFGTLPSENT